MAATTKKKGKKPRILFIGKRFYTNKDALEERYGRIYQQPYHWAQHEVDVQLWLVDYHSRETRTIKDGALLGVSSPLLSLNSLSAFLSSCFKFKPLAVVASGDCYIGLLGWLISLVCRARFVFDIYDKYDEFGAYRNIAGFDLFRFLRKRSALRLYASNLLARSLDVDSKFDNSIVPNGVDSNLFRPMPLQECRAKLGLPMEMKLVGYFGSMEPARGVNDLIEAVKHMRDRGVNVHMLACGKWSPTGAAGRDWVIYGGEVPHAMVPFFMNSCDVLAIPYQRSSLVDTSASCKIAEYISCQRPIVSTRTPNFIENFPEQAAILGEALCEPGDVKALARSIEFQLENAIILPPVRDLSWASIARHSLRAILATLPEI